jgi:hypothetical protein
MVMLRRRALDPSIQEIVHQLSQLRLHLRPDLIEAQSRFSTAVLSNGNVTALPSTLIACREHLAQARHRILALRPTSDRGRRAQRVSADALHGYEMAFEQLALSCRTHDQAMSLQHVQAAVKSFGSANVKGKAASRLLKTPWPL